MSIERLPARPVAALPAKRVRTASAGVLEEKFRLLLSKPGTMLVVLALLEHGTLTRRGLTEVTGMSWGGASYHTTALEKVGALLNLKTEEGVRLRLLDPATTRRLLDSLYSGWATQPVVGGALWKRLQGRVQQRRRREYEPWYQREKKSPARRRDR